MTKKLLTLLIGLTTLSSVFSADFTSFQLASTTITTGNILQTRGGKNIWVGTSTLFNTASASLTGLLSSTDWSTFNNKAPTASPTFTGVANFANASGTGITATDFYGGNFRGAIIGTTGTFSSTLGVTGKTTLGLASTTAETITTLYSTSIYPSGITSSFLATDSTGKIIATTTSGGTTYTGTYPIQVSGSVISTGFSTSTTNVFSAVNTFNSDVTVNGLNIGGYLKDDSNATGTAGQVLSSTGTSTLWKIPPIMFSTIFETAARFTSTLVGSGATTFDTNGVLINSAATATSSASLTVKVSTSPNIKLNDRNAQFTTIISGGALTSTLGTQYIGVGDVTVNGAGHTFTDSHFGFKLVAGTGTVSLYGTQSDGTEAVTGALTTLATNETLELFAVLRVGSGIDYYWRKDGGVLSSATTLTTNIPTATENLLQVSASNGGPASNFNLRVHSMSFER